MDDLQTSDEVSAHAFTPRYTSFSLIANSTSLLFLLEKVTFIPETIEPIVLDAIEAVLKDKVFNELMVQVWIDDICSRITAELIEMKKPFKYIGQSVT